MSTNVQNEHYYMDVKTYQSLSKLLIYFHMVPSGKSVIFIGSW